MASIPQHVAIIMDGNGRWAQERGYIRTRGHKEGANRVDDIVTYCAEIKVKYLSLYAFSTENWFRPKPEVSMLMRLLAHHLRTMDKKLIANGVRLVTSGSTHRLPGFVQRELERVKKSTYLEDPKLYLNLCLSYGGRQEILEAAQAIAVRVKNGSLNIDQITEESFRQFFFQPSFPDPDLLIRTGGEYRVSNFLLWQIAYSEIYTTHTLWPEFRPQQLDEAIAEFSKRQRRFGLTQAQASLRGTSEANDAAIASFERGTP